MPVTGKDNAMLDINALPENVREELVDAVEGKDTTMRMQTIRRMDAYEALDTFLKYNGIIGYTGTIIKALDGIRAAEIK